MRTVGCSERESSGPCELTRRSATTWSGPVRPAKVVRVDDNAESPRVFWGAVTRRKERWTALPRASKVVPATLNFATTV